MQKAILAIIFILNCSHALADINCHFDRFHQVSHTTPELTGYSPIDQSIEIINLKTSEVTLKLDGAKRATNSTCWLKVERKDWSSYETTYAGDFGELLVIDHHPDESTDTLKGWYRAALISTDVDSTHTRLGKCLIN
jgi:hypothetical protein